MGEARPEAPGPENSYIAAGSVGAREVGARATLDPSHRLRRVQVEFVKASGTCFPESWRREMRHGKFGAPGLFGPRSSSVSTDAAKKRFVFRCFCCRRSALATRLSWSANPSESHMCFLWQSCCLLPR